ncbi:MAG: phosphotransferase, partial [Acidimicrobiia bacterium]|nr:phosphotransferase [Acidimicrobiia bacterium]
ADTDAERHRRELLGLRGAQRAGCPVPDVIDRVGGDINVLILRALDGSPLTGRDDATTWSTVGAGLTELHGVELSGEVCTGAGRGADDRVGGFLAYARGGVSVDDDLVADGAALVTARLTGEVNGVQIHGDCQPDHFLLDDDRRRVVGVLDFGDAGRGDPLWDIAVLTFDHADRVDAVLGGYADPALAERAATELTGYWALRCLTEIRWLAEHGYDNTTTRERLERLLS